MEKKRSGGFELISNSMGDGEREKKEGQKRRERDKPRE